MPPTFQHPRRSGSITISALPFTRSVVHARDQARISVSLGGSAPSLDRVWTGFGPDLVPIWTGPLGDFGGFGGGLSAAAAYSCSGQ